MLILVMRRSRQCEEQETRKKYGDLLLFLLTIAVLREGDQLFLFLLLALTRRHGGSCAGLDDVIQLWAEKQHSEARETAQIGCGRFQWAYICQIEASPG